MTTSPPTDEVYEETHVHAVYEQIASHFSSTRYKPWPIIEDFLKALPPGSIGLDVGCGNGKYLAVNQNVYIVGSDRSTNLAKIAATSTSPSTSPSTSTSTSQPHTSSSPSPSQPPPHSHQSPHSVVVADILHLPHPPGTFDFALSIAVVHHLSTTARRRTAIGAVLEMLRPATSGNGGDDSGVGNGEDGIHGKEIEPENADSGGKALLYVWALEQESSRRGWRAGDAQDVMVPWVRKQGAAKNQEKTKPGGVKQQEQKVKAKEETFQRYYHLYRRGELEEDVVAAGGEVIAAGYEKDNWWVVARRRVKGRVDGGGVGRG